MKLRPPPFALLLAIAAFVFAQLMGAVHACEMGVDGSAMVHAATATTGGGDCCDHGQPPSDPACGNHCLQAYKAPERANAGIAVAFDIARVPILTQVVRAANAPPSAFIEAPDLGRHTEPSISIRNCCFRI